MTRITHADFNALIDAVERGRLELAYRDAIRLPSPENIAALNQWPSSWVAELQPVYGTPKDRRLAPRVESVENRRSPNLKRPSFWEWLCWKWFEFRSRCGVTR